MTARAAAAVRPLTTDDVPRLVELERELFGAGAWSAPMLAEELAGPARWYVGVDDAPADGSGPTTLVAYAGLWFDGDTATVMTLGVARAAQRRGLGALLLDALVARAGLLGADALLLEVRVDNDPAIALYRGAGFEVLGRRRRYYQPEDVDAFTMGLTLGPAEPAPPSATAPAATYPGPHG
ncbi:ribosomal protein S18-alanine N-acetyltransferase [Actinotalea solisilvae]|uniref:ribosomal protein S18-alanine N-acetyltransferase n=1 Tax=Actinotalea solisilvae TaxID=2072922 RepID=UPI0018F18122|nr:ribosomal protein S18-alanine N-acetyltransferase [Actinotalea solisilvae]